MTWAPGQQSLKWVPGRCHGKVKAASVILTIFPSECQLVYKNIVTSTVHSIHLRNGMGLLLYSLSKQLQRNDNERHTYVHSKS